MRTKQHWMQLEQHEIDDLDQSDWEHYSRGGCLCFARSCSECICGSWDVNLEDYVNDNA